MEYILIMDIKNKIRGGKKMTLYEDLEWRGLVQEISSPELMKN